MHHARVESLVSISETAPTFQYLFSDVMDDLFPDCNTAKTGVYATPNETTVVTSGDVLHTKDILHPNATAKGSMAYKAVLYRVAGEERGAWETIRKHSHL